MTRMNRGDGGQRGGRLKKGIMSQLPDGGLVGPAALLFTATVIGSGLDFLFHVFMARNLDVNSYSELAALMSMLMILSLPMRTVHNIMTRFVTQSIARAEPAKISWLMMRMILITSAIGLAFVAVMVILTPFIVDLFSLSSPLLVLILAVGVVFKLLWGVFIGVNQAFEMFGWMSIQQILAAVSKIVVGVTVVLLGYGVGGAFTAAAFAAGAAMAIAALPVLKHMTKERQPFDMRRVGLYAMPSLVAALSFGILTNVDLIAVRVFIEGDVAGQFAAASQLSKLLVFIPGAVGTVLFPKVTTAIETGNDPMPIFKKAALWSLVLCVTPTLVIALVPELVMRIVYGEAYVGAAGVLVILCMAMTLFGLASLFMVFGLATDGNRFIAIIAFFSVVEVVSMSLYNETIEQLALVILVVSALMSVFCLLYLTYAVRSGDGPYWKRHSV